MKARVILEQEKFKMFEENAKDSTVIAVAALLYALHIKNQDKSKEERENIVKTMFEDIRSVYNMPPIFGNRLKSNDIIELIESEYGINLDTINIVTETYEESLKNKRRK